MPLQTRLDIASLPLSHFPYLANSKSILYNAAMIYKVIEICTVTDEEIERALNEWVGKGYAFESIQFVTSVSSKRPTMAFLFFTGKE